MRRLLTLVSLTVAVALLAAPAFAQSPPAALQAQTAGTGQIILTWTAVAGATQYYVYLGTQSGGPYTTRSYSTNATTTHLSIGSLSDTTTYYAVVKTVVSGTAGPASQQVSVCSGSAQLAAPANLAGTATSGQVALTWSSVPGASAYDVYRSPDAAGNQDGLLVSGLTGTTYTDTGVTNGTTYTYQVAAVCATGEGTQCGPVAETPLSPPALSAEATANQQHTEIDLSWTASTGATSYTLNRSTASGSETAYQTITGGTTYADTSVTANTTYYYTIAAVAGSSSSAPSGEVSAKAGSALLAAPTLTVSSANAQASLSWTTVSGATYYDVYRATGASTPVFYAHLSNVTAYTDNNLSNGTTYVYQVAAGSVNGQGTLSNSVSVTPLAAPTISAAAVSSGEIDLSWTASLGATVYHLDRSTSSGNGPWTLIASSSGTKDQDTGLTAGTNYWYHVQAVATRGSSNSSNSVLAETASGTPTGLTATPGSSQVSLSWTAPAGDVGSYRVYRGTASGGESTTALASGLPGTTYTDVSAVNGTTYYYQVSAVDQGGEGTWSNEASARPPYAPPTVATAASASPNPVGGTTTQLSALGASAGGAANLTYTWSCTGPAAVTYSGNGTNGAGQTRATFTQAGTYTFTVVIADRYGASVASSVSVTVVQTPSDIAVMPAALSLVIGSTQTFTASLLDQFGHVISGQSFEWSVDNRNYTIDPTTGVFSAGFFAGTATVTATDADLIGSASVTVTDIPPTVAAAASASPNPVTGTVTSLSVLGADVCGERTLRYTWWASGPGYVSFSDNGTNTAKTAMAAFTLPGTYTLTATIEDDSGYTVSSSVTVTVNQTLTRIQIFPSVASTSAGAGFPFLVYLYDQFGDSMTGASLAWSVLSGTGTIDANGDFTAPSGAETDLVQAAGGGVTGTAVIYVTGAGSPTVATAASATPNPVTGTTASLSVLGADALGESTLTYTWQVSGITQAPVTFSDNGTNAAKTATATFSEAGFYRLTVTITDSLGLSTTSSVSVTVSQTPTSLTLFPAVDAVNVGQSLAFYPLLWDQFGNAIGTDPFTWAVTSGTGTVSSGGVFTAPQSAETDTVTATSGGVSGTATVYVTETSGPAVVLAASASPSPVTGTTTTLSVLGSDAGGESALLYLWSCTGPAPVTYSDNGTNSAKTTTVTFSQAGTYVFTVTLLDGINPSVTSSVTVTVNQAATFVSVSPINVQLSDGATQQFAASDVDQFGTAMPTQPSSFTWAVTDGTGTVTPTGLYTAPEPTAYSVAVNETDLVQASDGSLTGVAEVSVSGLPGGPTGFVAPPSAPTNLKAAAGDKQVTLTWDSNPAISEYLIYRSYSPGGEGPGPIASVGGGSGTGITYVDTGLTNHQIYYYTVTAVYGGLESAFSNEVSATPFNVPPTFTAPPSASPPVVTGTGTPGTGTGTTLTAMPVSGDQPPSKIIITWRVIGSAPVTFSDNGDTSASTTTATFTAAGTYVFTVYATDADGATTTSTVTVVVQQTLTAVAVLTPSPSAPIAGGGSYFFQTGGTDQFGNPMSSAGATYTVSPNSGSVTASTSPPGVLFHAPGGLTTAQTFTITMTDGTFSKTITVTVAASAANSGYWAPGAQPGFTASVTVTKNTPGTGSTSHTLTTPSGEDGVTLSNGQSGSVSLSGSITWPFIWTPDAQNDPPPSVSYFAVTGGVGGTVSDYLNANGGGSPSASDGFGDPEQDTSGPYQGSGSQAQGIVSNASSGGTYLFKEGSSASVSVATKQFTASASGSVGANDGGLVQAGYNFDAGPVAPPSVGVTAPTNDAILTAGGDVSVSVHGDPTFLPNDSSNPLQSLSLKVTGGTGGGGDLTPDGDGNAMLDLGVLPAGQYTATVAAKYTNGSGTVEVDSQPVTFYVASFTVKTNSWNPNPAYVSQIITGQVQGNLDPSSLDGGGSGPFFVVYNWTTAGVWYSQDGTAGSFEPYGGNGVVSWQQGQASTTFSAQFFAPGQYLLEVQCVATVYSQSTGAAVAVFTQTGYIGGDAGDIDQSGGGSGHAQKAHGKAGHRMTAHDGGGAGITVVPATVTFFDTSIKLGLGAPTAYQKIITAVVTPGYEINSISFTALNNFGGPSDET